MIACVLIDINIVRGTQNVVQYNSVFFFLLCTGTFIYCTVASLVKQKVKQSRYRPGVTQRVPGS